jgi:hypothetical protein
MQLNTDSIPNNGVEGIPALASAGAFFGQLGRFEVENQAESQ